MDKYKVLFGILIVIIIVLAYLYINTQKCKPCEVCKVCEKLPNCPVCPVCEECEECPVCEECEECEECEDCNVYHKWTKDSMIPILISSEFDMAQFPGRKIRFKPIIINRRPKDYNIWAGGRSSRITLIAVQEKRTENSEWELYPYTYIISRVKKGFSSYVGMPYEAVHTLKNSTDPAAKQKAECVIEKASITFLHRGGSISMDSIDQLKFKNMDCMSANLPTDSWTLYATQDYADMLNKFYITREQSHPDIFYASYGSYDLYS
jgi:hypothetical protein